MSKVAEEDERETCTFLPARGRFLLCNRGTQLGTMCWPRASSEPDSTTKTRECPPCMREKEEKKRGKKERDDERFCRGLFALFDAVAILWHAWHDAACSFYELTEQVHAWGEASDVKSHIKRSTMRMRSLY